MFEVTAVDEDLEGPPPCGDAAAGRRHIERHVVDGDINRVIAVGPFQFVGRAFENARARQRLGHVDDLGGAFSRQHRGARRGGGHNGRNWGLNLARRITKGRDSCDALFVWCSCRRGTGFNRAQHRACHRIGPIGRAALEAEVIGLLINVAEGIKAETFWAVDGLGYGAVDMGLESRLHGEMIRRQQAVRADKRRCQRGSVTKRAPVGGMGKVFDGFNARFT